MRLKIRIVTLKIDWVCISSVTKRSGTFVETRRLTGTEMIWCGVHAMVLTEVVEIETNLSSNSLGLVVSGEISRSARSTDCRRLVHVRYWSNADDTAHFSVHMLITRHGKRGLTGRVSSQRPRTAQPV